MIVESDFETFVIGKTMCVKQNSHEEMGNGMMHILTVLQKNLRMNGNLFQDQTRPLSSYRCIEAFLTMNLHDGNMSVKDRISGREMSIKNLKKRNVKDTSTKGKNEKKNQNRKAQLTCQNTTGFSA